MFNYDLEKFMDKNWHGRQACLLESFVDTNNYGYITKQYFFENATKPVICAGYENPRTGDGFRYQNITGYVLLDIEKSKQVYNHYKRKKDKLTLFMYNLNKKLKELEEMRVAFGIDHQYRTYDIGATISPHMTTIGFHADDKDVMIVQMEGERVWRVWKPDSLPQEYKYGIIRQGNQLPEPPPITSDEPFIDVRIKKGDALYIPALWPHEGFTMDEDHAEDSVSLSFSWVILTPKTFFINDWGLIPDKCTSLVEKHKEEFYKIIPDPINEPIIEYYVNYLIDLFEKFNIETSDLRERLNKQVVKLFELLEETNDIRLTQDIYENRKEV